MLRTAIRWVQICATQIRQEDRESRYVVMKLVSRCLADFSFLQYFDIEVKNPRTHIDKGRALYTDYEIHVKVSTMEQTSMKFNSTSRL